MAESLAWRGTHDEVLVRSLGQGGNVQSQVGLPFRFGPPDRLATWPSGLGKGLQSPVPGFDSQRRLSLEGVKKCFIDTSCHQA